MEFKRKIAKIPPHFLRPSGTQAVLADVFQQAEQFRPRGAFRLRGVACADELHLISIPAQFEKAAELAIDESQACADGGQFRFCQSAR